MGPAICVTRSQLPVKLGHHDDAACMHAGIEDVALIAAAELELLHELERLKRGRGRLRVEAGTR